MKKKEKRISAFPLFQIFPGKPEKIWNFHYKKGEKAKKNLPNSRLFFPKVSWHHRCAPIWKIINYGQYWGENGKIHLPHLWSKFATFVKMSLFSHFFLCNININFPCFPIGFSPTGKFPLQIFSVFRRKTGNVQY